MNGLWRIVPAIYKKKYKRWVQICQKILYLITNKKLYEKSLHANVIISWSLD